MRQFENILVTGGAGFIGCNFIHYLFNDTDFQGSVINLDILTYAGNQNSLKEIEKTYGQRYIFEKADICDRKKLDTILEKYDVDTIVHFAAETHVDRSILGPAQFIQTNIVGTFTLLEAAHNVHKKKANFLFHHISTDEVYGSLGEKGYFLETTPYDPRSPYSASKASSDHLVMSYHHTYGLPITLSNCSNNYGEFQFPEKLIPLMILNICKEKQLPVYGDGKNIRDWLYVYDHVSAIYEIIKNGKTGETYNIGGECEKTNIDVVNTLCEEIAKFKGKNRNYFKKLITFVDDRLGHDRRYAIDCTKIKKELSWKPSVTFEEGIAKTIKWYLDHHEWTKNKENKH